MNIGTQPVTNHYRDKALFLLTDQKTFSTVEAMAFVLKNRKLANIFSNKTAGAGNISGQYMLADSYLITIPVGVIISPVTKTGWEKIGANPDV